MKYDIFISYRRKDSSGRLNVATARQFKMAFEGPPYNYKVFFDFNECTDNYFSEIILPAIRTCDFFVLVLTKDCLARCFNEGDWVRREIEEALSNNRKIIPITPDNECNAWPNLPDSLRELDGLTITTIHTDHMFDACVDFLVKNRLHLNNDDLWGGKDQKAKQERIAAEGKQIDLKQETTGSFNGHEYVDLGLPSGTLWATCNIGANRPEDYGTYYSWDDGKTAAANWGNGWQMPSEKQWEELKENTKSTWAWRKSNGVEGRLFTAKNGNRIFLPAAGSCQHGEFRCVGSYGIYWSGSLLKYMPMEYAYDLNFNSVDCMIGHYSRRFCLPVRAVRVCEN